MINSQEFKQSFKTIATSINKTTTSEIFFQKTNEEFSIFVFVLKTKKIIYIL
jgi:hypothetical protein